MRTLLKTLSYGVTHVTVATTLAYYLSGNWAIALSIGLLEPAVQTGVFYVHENLWESSRKRNLLAVPAENHYV